MTLPRDFWVPGPMPIIPVLAELRSIVLERSHNRLPKWRFKLAHDLVVQGQPRPAERRDRFFLFACRALQGDSISRESFVKRDRQFWQLDFGILAEGDDRWRLKTRHLFWPNLHRAEPAEVFEFKRRIIDSFKPARFEKFSPEMMLSHQCMICGKPLTDPASMGRMIGPECAGTSSLSLPGVWKAAAQEVAR
jgi:uncharacterized protein DUF6011